MRSTIYRREGLSHSQATCFGSAVWEMSLLEMVTVLCGSGTGVARVTPARSSSSRTIREIMMASLMSDVVFLSRKL